MVGDFMVCVDRLIASAACFDSSSAAISSDEFPRKAAVEEEGSSKKSSSLKFMKYNGGELENKVSECRICQEEGDEAEMESPCACNGTLKFAHRKCIQRWCDKKGDITCEICNQEYAPNYSVPLTRANPPDVMAIDIRQGWGGRLDLDDAQLIAIQQEILNSEYEDYAAAHNSGIACCRTVALILMLLLLLRHILVVLTDAEMLVDASDYFNLSFQLAWFLLPCYLIVRSCYILQTRRRRHV